MRKLAISVLAVFVLMAALTSLTAAQRTSARTSMLGRSNAGLHSRAGNFAPVHRRASPFFSPYESLPFPFFGDAFNPDDIYSTGYPVASPPPAILMQALQTLAAPNAKFPGSMPVQDSQQSSSNQPLLIELQNGRYVHVNNPAIDGEAQPLTATAAKLEKPARIHSTKPVGPDPSPTLPAAVLIFRDGHREEVRDYTIAQGSLYARGNYYTDGYWSKKIDLGNLDLPNTQQANAARNVNFTRPASQNEIITRF
jgi:hypothetical protein